MGLFSSVAKRGNYMKKLFFSQKFKTEIKDISLVLIGCLLLALADAIFIMPCNIINGGVDSLAIIVNHYLEPIFGFNFTDIVMIAMQIILWIVSLLTLGKKFTFHTLLGTLAFPLFYSFLLRINFNDLVGITSMYSRHIDANGNIELSLLIIAACFGGLLSGAGVSFAYLGNGSTGGFDVISFLIAKYSSIKQDLSGFIEDATLIIIGLFVFKNWELALVGILSAFMCVISVQFIYIYTNSFIIVDIISDKNEEIKDYVHNELDRASTLVNTIGGYTGEKRQMLRVIISKIEMGSLKSFIAAIDKNAFVSFVQAKAINGNGFEPFVITLKQKKRIIKKYQKNKKNNKKELYKTEKDI